MAIATCRESSGQPLAAKPIQHLLASDRQGH